LAVKPCSIFSILFWNRVYRNSV